MTKLLLTDNFDDIVLKMSEGNPGAMTTIFEIFKAKNNDVIDAIPLFLTLDMMGLYGSHLYMLWNDSCNRDVEKVIKVIEAYRSGTINNVHIYERIQNVGYGKSFDDLLGE